MTQRSGGERVGGLNVGCGTRGRVHVWVGERVCADRWANVWVDERRCELVGSRAAGLVGSTVWLRLGNCLRL